MINGMEMSEFVRMFCIKPSLCGSPLEITIGKHLFISYPIDLPQPSNRWGTSFFNVVFTMLKHECDHVMLFVLRRVVTQLSQALEYETKRVGFVSLQVYICACV